MPAARVPSASLRGRSRTVLALLLALGLTAPVATAAAAADAPEAPPSVAAPPRTSTPGDVAGLIVEVRAGRGIDRARDRVAQVTGRSVAVGAHLGGGARTLEFDAPLDLADAQRTAEQLEREGLVLAATPDVRVSVATVPDDPEYGRQWNLSGRYATTDAFGVEAETAWATTQGANSVVVAVLDTGVLPHPDIVDRLVPGYDLVDHDADASDPGDWCDEDPNPSSSWHGTHVAGIVGATTDNALGVAGVDQRARIQPVRVLGPCGGWLSDIITGIRWAAGVPVTGLPTNATPADVLNLSLGAGESCRLSMQRAIDDAMTAGSLVVAAAGNANTDAGGFTPGNCDGVVTVAATSRVGDRAYYSNHGAAVDVAAPGGDTRYGSAAAIYSLDNTGTTAPATNGYGYKQGTSMAAPHVAGVASLALSLDGSLSVVALRDLLIDSVRPFATSSPYGATSVCSDDPTATYHCGSGIVSAAAAVEALPPGTEAPLTEPAPAAPSAPVLSRTAGVEKVDLTWTASTHASGIAGYDLHRTTGSTCPTTSSSRVYRGTTRAFTDTAVTAGTTYRYCVVARSVDGQVSTRSNTVSATPTAAPAPLARPSWPADATLTFDLEGSGLRLAWPRAGGTVDRYEVFRDGTRIASTTSRSALVTGLKVDQRSLLQVRARNSSGSSPALDRHVTPSGPFSDVDQRSPFRIDIAWLATAETTRGCGGDRFCPGAAVTRQQMAAFLTRGLGLTATSGIRFSDVPRDSPFATDIDKLATAGITLGCGGDRFCPSDDVTRQQMAAFLTRGLGLTATSGIRFSDVPRGSAAERDIDRLATAGITLGCGGDRFCPGADVRRQQMAAFLRRGLAS